MRQVIKHSLLVKTALGEMKIPEQILSPISTCASQEKCFVPAVLLVSTLPQFKLLRFSSLLKIKGSMTGLQSNLSSLSL
jgi:hypothetical protein